MVSNGIPILLSYGIKVNTMTVWEGIIVALMSSLIALVLGLFIEYRTGWFAGRQRKELSYEIPYFATLISADDASGEIEVFYRGEPIKNLWSFVIKIINTGKVPIISDDYVRSIVISLMGKVVKYQVVETTPHDLLPEFVIVEDSETGYYSGLRMSKLLLNSGDSITLSLLVSDYGGGLEISGRIAGVKEIKDGLQVKTNYFIWGAVFMTVAFAIALLFRLYDLFDHYGVVVVGAIVISGYVLYSLYRMKRMKR